MSLRRPRVAGSEAAMCDPTPAAVAGANEDALTAEIMRLAGQFGRYGDRRITALAPGRVVTITARLLRPEK